MADTNTVETNVADARVADEPEIIETDLSRARVAHTLSQQLEALLIVADEPLSAVTLATATDRPVREVRAALNALIADFNGSGEGAGSASPRGFELREVAGGYRFYVRESLDPVVADFVQQQTPSKLSQAALETLAVIAYRQPISRGAIASIRAVNVDSVVRTLLGRGLITEVGHDPETTATLYGTSEALLGFLGIGDVSELPPIAPLLDDGSEGFDHEQF
jgi:segregation and condensation protein B